MITMNFQVSVDIVELTNFLNFHLGLHSDPMFYNRVARTVEAAIEPDKKGALMVTELVFPKTFNENGCFLVKSQRWGWITAVMDLNTQVDGLFHAAACRILGPSYNPKDGLELILL